MIKNYFNTSVCVLIDEMNLLLQRETRDKQIEYARKLSEDDLVFRLSAPLRNLVRNPVRGSRGQDIYIEHNGDVLIAEVKYWRNWIAGTGVNKRVWDQAFGNAFDWLLEEIRCGNKNKRVIICGWFTVFEWRELLQLGSTIRDNPPVNTGRLEKLPFLTCEDDRVGKIRTDYATKSGEVDYDGINVNWELYGDVSDLMNMALLY